MKRNKNQDRKVITSMPNGILPQVLLQISVLGK